MGRRAECSAMVTVVMTISVYLYFLVLGLLALYGIHRTYLLLSLYLRPYVSPECLPLTIGEDEFPRLCVQLPLFNEEQVAERVIRAAAGLEYEEGKLEIQVLDDSTDSTSEIVDRVVEELKGELESRGATISVLRRESRDGFKAGALQAGLDKTEAQLVAIFDADFVPDPDFLLRALPPLLSKENRNGFVQARWGFLNRGESLLTRGQAVLLDGHFIIEHSARYLSTFFNFNGTAGIWKRDAIVSAGGWSGDTLTEDLDLSYRALMAGWRGCYLRDLVCNSELPRDVTAFKAQQYRWMKGQAQVAKKILPRLFRTDLPLKFKIEAFFHLTSGVCYFLMLIVGALLVPVTAFRSYTGIGLGLWFESGIFCATVVSLVFFYLAAHRLQGIRARMVDIICAILLGGGLAINCARAFLSGIFGRISPFVRTPKVGEQPVTQEVIFASTFSDRLNSTMREHYKEVLFVVYLAGGVCYLLNESMMRSIPFVLLLLSGYLKILITALQSSYGREKNLSR